MSILLSGQLATLLTRLTAARAAFLDVAISSRAPSSTALTDGTWTDARAAKLDNLDAAISSVGASPPTTNGLKGIITSNGDIETISNLPTTGVLISASEAAYNTWKTLINVTSSAGIIELMSVKQIANTNSWNAQLRFKIDGNIVYTSDAGLWNASGNNGKGIMLAGVAVSGGIAMGQIAFTDSFLLEFRKTQDFTGTIEIGARVRYCITG